ncbi:MAG: MBL fold metallo-hydrolase [Planctomycetota bacterium]
MIRLFSPLSLCACTTALLSSPTDLRAEAPTVHVITEGYVQPIEGKEFVPGKVDDGERKVAGTVVLVKAVGATIVADPGMVADRNLILDGLAQHGVTPADVTHVFISHHHPDHTVNIGMFPKAKTIDFIGEYENDVWRDHPNPATLAPGVRVLRTPGHTNEDASLLVETDEGVYALTHVWWNEQMQPEVDPLAEAPETLIKSRQLILDVADWIIPGHGRKFANPRKRKPAQRKSTQESPESATAQP